MEIHSIRTLYGPNLYSHQPVQIMKLSLSDLDNVDDIPAFMSRLSELFPELKDRLSERGQNRSWRNYPQSWVETNYFARAIASIALALTERIGYPASDAMALKKGEPGYCYIIVQYKNEQGTHSILQTAAEVADAIVKG